MAALSPLAVQQFLDASGAPRVGAKLFTYLAGTSTKGPTYTSAAGNVENTNPIILDGLGDAEVWLNPAIAYKFVLATPNDSDPPTDPIWTVDDITVDGSASAGSVFATLALAQAAQIAGSVTIVTLLGYYAPGDGGGAAYRRADVQSAGAGKFQSADGTWWQIAEMTVTPLMLGAVADGVVDDAVAEQNTLSLGVRVEIDPGLYANGSTISVPANTQVDALGAELLPSNIGDGWRVAGSRARLTGPRLTSTTVNQGVAVSATVINADISALEVVTSASSGSGNAIAFAGDGQTSLFMSALRLTAKAYGVLVNCVDSGAAAVARLLIRDFDIEVGTGDPIAINSPAKAVQNVIVSGGFLRSLTGAGNGGLGLSLARTQGFVVSNFIVETATFEGLHLEDGCRHGVAHGFVVRAGASRAGIYYSLEGTAPTDALPIVIADFSVHGAATKAGAVAASVGQWSTFTDAGAPTRSPIGPGYLHGFQYGVWASGAGPHAHHSLSVAECNYALKVGGNDRDWTVIPGRFFTKNIDAFVYVNSGAAFDIGEFHHEGFLPAAFVVYNGGTPFNPGVLIRAFSGHAQDCLLSVGSGYNNAPLFPSPRRMWGRLTVWTDDGAGFGNIWSGTVLYDGITYTVTDTYRSGTANFEISLTPTMGDAAGDTYIQIFNAGAAGAYTAQIRVRFEGEYYA